MKRDNVIVHFGGVRATAAALGITRSAVYQWDDIIPRGCAYKMQVITGGKMQVDPALYPPKKKPIRADA